MCASTERGFAHPDHDIYATAHTRAKNRAISDMIAAGEVSAEEVMDGGGRSMTGIASSCDACSKDPCFWKKDQVLGCPGFREKGGEQVD